MTLYTVLGVVALLVLGWEVATLSGNSDIPRSRDYPKGFASNPVFD